MQAILQVKKRIEGLTSESLEARPNLGFPMHGMTGLELLFFK